MINQEVIYWIVKNEAVYFRKQGLKGEQLREKLRKINNQMKKIMLNTLKKKRQVQITNFITFFVQNTHNHTLKVSYNLCDSLNMVISSQNSKKCKKKQYQIQQFHKQLAASLMFDLDEAKLLLLVFGKAICDLVVNNHKLQLNFDFCLLKLSKGQCKCKINTKFIQEINQKQVKMHQQNVRLLLCPYAKAHKDIQNITLLTKNREQHKWNEIKYGNLYDRPSLQQIKNLYDKGRELQIKHKHCFDNN